VTNDTHRILAIDLGTSGPKVALLSARGAVIGAAAEPVGGILFGPGGMAEQAPQEWWAAICAAARRLLARNLVPLDSIAAVACTGQWGGTVAVGADGAPLMNAVIWADTRGAPYVRRVTGGPVRFEGYGVDKLWHWLRRTGGIPTRGGKDPIAHILWIKHERPAVYAAAHKFLDVKDYLNLRLTGRCATSPDTATIMWVTDNRNVHAIDYDPLLLRLAGLEREKLPDLLPAASFLGPLLPGPAAELGLPPGVPVAVSTCDLVSAAVGSGAVHDGEAHVYVGTSTWLMCHVPFKKTDLLHNMATLPSALPGKYLLTNEQDVAGGALAFLRDNVIYPADALGTPPAPDDAYARFDALAAATPPGSNGALFTPWLNGERSPVEDLTARGGWHNLSLRATRGDLVRAVFEGVALNLRWLLPYVERLARTRLGAIRIVGGGAQSDVWCQIYADVLNRPILQVEDPVLANARGAAFLAGMALGSVRVEELPGLAPVARTFTPQAGNRAVYDQAFAAFLEIYRKNKGIYRMLNRA
jgi:xylulokinase